MTVNGLKMKVQYMVLYIYWSMNETQSSDVFMTDFNLMIERLKT